MHYSLLFSYFYLHRIIPFQLQTMQRRLRSHRGASIVQCIEEHALTGTCRQWRHTYTRSTYSCSGRNRVMTGVSQIIWYDIRLINKRYQQVREYMQRFETRTYCTFGHICFNNVSVPMTSGAAPTYLAIKTEIR
jgi:hypothetical protein